MTLPNNSLKINQPSSLALTSPMGWNSWNTFGHNINETVVRETADAFVTSGLKDCGYNYIIKLRVEPHETILLKVT